MKLAKSKSNEKIAEKLGILLFDAYFTKNLKLADKDVLVDVASKAGLEKDEIQEVLDSDLYKNEVEKDEYLAFSMGIHAVPFYLLDGKYSVPGALSYSDFKKVLTQIMSENGVWDCDESDSCKDGICRI